MTIIVSTPTSQRITRVVNDICALQHDNGAKARARAARWIAHVLADAASRRRWWFAERTVATLLAQGEDVVDLKGDLDKIVAVYCGARLEKDTLAHVTALRQAAAADGRNNAGRPRRYALEQAGGALRVHLWPAPGASSAFLVSAVDTGTEQLTVPANTTLTTGARARLATTGTLPAPLALNTTYYAIRVDDTHIQLAASLAAAKAGTAIDLTDAGAGAHTVLAGLTPFAALYTRPLDLAMVPPFWETVVVNGVLGTFGRHFDRDQLAADPEDFEARYEKQLLRAGTDAWEIERARRFDDVEATELQAVGSEAGSAVSFTVPASLTGIGYVTIETGDYPLVVS